MMIAIRLNLQYLMRGFDLPQFCSQIIAGGDCESNDGPVQAKRNALYYPRPSMDMVLSIVREIRMNRSKRYQCHTVESFVSIWRAVYLFICNSSASATGNYPCRYLSITDRPVMCRESHRQTPCARRDSAFTKYYVFKKGFCH